MESCPCRGGRLLAGQRPMNGVQGSGKGVECCSSRPPSSSPLSAPHSLSPPSLRLSRPPPLAAHSLGMAITSLFWHPTPMRNESRAHGEGRTPWPCEAEPWQACFQSRNQRPCSWRVECRPCDHTMVHRNVVVPCPRWWGEGRPCKAARNLSSLLITILPDLAHSPRWISPPG